MIRLILSVDYEIFGNGSGDVRRDMIEPTRRLLALCGRYGAKLTIMFEVGEYWAMKQAEEAGSLHVGYSPSRLIEEQIQYAVRRGHDAQLHLHPWWIGATFEENRWRLHPEWRGISDLPNSVGSRDDPLSAVGVLSRGKQTLESIVRTAHPEYECLVHRAGSFWGQPSQTLIAGMKQVGLIADSSVVKGLYEEGPVPMDYRQAESETGYWWTRADDISLSGPKGKHLIEFPVCSEMKPYLGNFRWTKLRATLKLRKHERANIHGHRMMQARKSTDSPIRVLKKLCTRQPMKYDFCKLSAGDMIRWLQRLTRDDRVVAGDLGMPVVMLGHSKDFWNDKNLALFLSFIRTQCQASVSFSTFGGLAQLIQGRDRNTAK